MKDRYGRTPLHQAARAGNLPEVERLLQSIPGKGGPRNKGKAELDAVDAHGFTALYHAAMFGFVPIVVLLAGAGANIHEADLGGLTPLHIACEKNHPTAVLSLLQLGADLDRVDSIGRTATAWALDKNHNEVLKTIQTWQGGDKGV